MLGDMSRVIKLAAAALLAVSMLFLGACGSSPNTVERANSLDGGALSNFNGPDGSDADARATARAIAGNRGYDFTSTGYTLTSGQATSWAILDSSDFTDGIGPLTIDGASSTVQFDVQSADPSVTNVQLSGTFDATEAQLAIDNPGASFIIQWTISWEVGGAPFTLTAEQTLLGSDWVEQ
jgi:hypothetical protein